MKGYFVLAVMSFAVCAGQFDTSSSDSGSDCDEIVGFVDDELFYGEAPPDVFINIQAITDNELKSAYAILYPNESFQNALDEDIGDPGGAVEVYRRIATSQKDAATPAVKEAANNLLKVFTLIVR